ncbi:response regulator [Pelagicoccus sp. SDUM812005]|uniref:response regulator n=1 Tax=Pelagicoccus sp. SDUM812005 TaxID=3041257 RepID=UPI00280F4FF1|nr:response regulator [Pelagicoccus sp. SDUM812005]MDQ8181256.1 response regulator [Pelagicoccus sp. SDUM812005]
MKTIITVDDASTIRKMVGFTLKSAGHQVLEAADGLEAYEKLKGKSVDLVITDVNMPRMDGIELTRKLRALPAYSRVPIVLLTTEAGAAKKSEGRAAGATGWIVKPFSQDQLLALVSRVLPN